MERASEASERTSDDVDIGTLRTEEPTAALPVARPRVATWNPTRVAVTVRVRDCHCVRRAIGARQLLDARDDRRGDLQHRRPRSQRAHRSGRDGVVVPVRARRRRRLGRPAPQLRDVDSVPVPAAHRRDRHRPARCAHRLARAATVRPPPRPDHADGRRGDHHRPAHDTVPERWGRPVRQLGSRRRIVADASPVDRPE